MMEAKIRKPAVAGQFYAGDAQELRHDLKECFQKCNASPLEHVQAVIVPHAGYVFSGVTAASAFASIRPDAQYEHIFLLGPSHHVYLDKASVNVEATEYATPLGNIPVDTALCKSLLTKSDAFTYNNRAHDSEHCLEVELPFLQYHFKKVAPIVPIIIATQKLSVLKEIAQVLQPYMNEKNLFVISSDFSHYPAYLDAKWVDGLTKDSIMTGKAEAFVNATLHNQELNIDSLATSACGEAAIAALLMMTEKDSTIHPHHIMYCNSGESPYGGKDRVVGYHSFVFTREEEKTDSLQDKAKTDNFQDKANTDSSCDKASTGFSLDDEEKQMLKGIARDAIKATLEGKVYHYPTHLTEKLKTKCGAFVSLHEHGRLRGCIGHFGEDTPLYETVYRMAKAAAFEDPRFPKVSLFELPDIDIEISVLTPMKRIHSIDEFQLGKQGIYMRKGYHAGTFLPQVADEVNWTKEEFLGHCAQDKAGIGWDGWKTAELYTYEAIVF